MTRVDLDGELTIVTAADTRDRLRPFLVAGPVEIGLAGVTDIDTAGLQLLLAARRSGEGPVTLADPSPVVSDLFTFTRLTEELEAR
ncbi:lipid asymmetry maintenance protein MlaB [Cryptosporangium sp. NPDC051539]|uniref:lipid asymmetry maintenance protein MlaB n=1 Tax=Cryptosporangium sp. NPDC051539 TaxID=3363962 RepID=UPI00379F68D6